MTKPILECRQPVLHGNTVVDSTALIQRQRNYKRTTRLIGGPWLASFEHFGDEQTPFDADWASKYFYHRLGYHFAEKRGASVLWDGQIAEVDFLYNGWGQRRSLLEVRNMVRAIWVDGETTGITSWVSDEASTRQYGVRQETLYLDKTSQAEAEDKTQSYLAEHAHPVPRSIKIDKKAKDSLVVRLQGYIFTANNKYVTVGDGSTKVPISTFVQSVATTDCDFLQAGTVVTNDSTTTNGSTSPIRAYDAIKEILMQRTDPTAPPWLIDVTPGSRHLNYRQLNVNPSYFWLNRQITTTMAGYVDPWEIRPGMVRNPYHPETSPPPNSFYLDGRDALVLEVTMGTGMETPALTSMEYADARLWKHLAGAGARSESSPSEIPEEIADSYYGNST